MTREQIISAADEVANALQKSGVIDLANGTGGHASLQDYLRSFKIYNILAEKFGDGARFLEAELGYAILREPDPWILLSKTGELEGNDLLKKVNGVMDGFAGIASLLARDQSRFISSKQNQEILTLVLLEDKHFGACTPGRLSEAVASISSLYEASTLLQGVDPEPLQVVGMDAGESMEVDFSGMRPIILSVKELVLSIWERVIFYRDQNVDERIASIANSLPILDRIGELKAQNTLTESAADLAKRRLIEGITKFLSSGSTIKELLDQKAFDPGTLMKPAGRPAQAPAPVSTSPAVATPPPPKPKAEATPQNGSAPASPKAPAEPPAQEAPPAPTPPPAKSAPPSKAAPPKSEPAVSETPPTLTPPADAEDGMVWDGILEDDLKTLRELIDKTKRSE